METKIKKLIAREFLALCLVSFLSIMAFAFTLAYNSYQSSQVNHMNKLISQSKAMADSLKYPYDKKKLRRTWLNQSLNNQNSSYEEFTDDDWIYFTEIVKHDSLSYRWNNVWSIELISMYKKIGFANPKLLGQFILINEITKSDIDNLNKAKGIENSEIKYLQKAKVAFNNNKLSTQHRYSIVFYSFLILLILTFGLRYLIYSIRWSLKTLKS